MYIRMYDELKKSADEELRNEIETQKMMFYLQQKERQSGEGPNGY